MSLRHTLYMCVATALLWMSCGNDGSRPDPVAELLATRGVPDFTITDSSEIKTYPNGLKIYTVLPGPGARPAEGGRVRMHYMGRVQGGEVIDDTWTRKEPFDFILGKTKLIPGMEEAVRKLSFGSRAVLIIPPALGYGEKDTPPNIPPKSTLIYHVELLGNI